MTKISAQKAVIILVSIVAFFGLAALVFFKSYISRDTVQSRQAKFRIVTTLFPIYDFARQIGGDRVDVSLLLPPGAEPHDFEPRPGDTKNIFKSDLLLYTSNEMEPWIARIKQQNTETQNARKTSIVSVDEGVLKMSGEDEHADVDEAEETSESHHEDEHDHTGIDPHYWLDPQNAVIMVQNITDEMSKLDSSNTNYYLANSKKLISKLKKLDQDISASLLNCKGRTIYHAGHFAFSYFANRYTLQYRTLQGFLPESETKASVMADFISSIKSEGAKSVYFEELVDPKVANIIASETGTKTYELNAVHSITSDNLQKGQTYEDVMRKNLQNLVEGLQCVK